MPTGSGVSVVSSFSGFSVGGTWSSGSIMAPNGLQFGDVNVAWDATKSKLGVCRESGDPFPLTPSASLSFRRTLSASRPRSLIGTGAEPCYGVVDTQIGASSYDVAPITVTVRFDEMPWKPGAVCPHGRVPGGGAGTRKRIPYNPTAPASSTAPARTEGHRSDSLQADAPAFGRNSKMILKSPRVE